MTKTEPFQVAIPDGDLQDLRDRLAHARWADDFGNADWRYGVVLTFSLGWLRQEENQHLSMPLADALALPAEMRTRLGFDMDYGDGGLGFYDPTVLI